jgi:hypothetical protein
MILSRDDLRAIREVVDDSVKGTNEIAGCRESAYDRYMRAAKLFEDKIKLLDMVVEVVKIHSMQIEELKRKQAQTQAESNQIKNYL